MLLAHEHNEREKYLTRDRQKDIIVPEELSLEESIAYIRSKKPKIKREEIIQKLKRIKESQEEEKSKRRDNLDSESELPV